MLAISVSEDGVHYIANVARVFTFNAMCRKSVSLTHRLNRFARSTLPSSP